MEMKEIDNRGDHRDHRLQRVARGATEPVYWHVGRSDRLSRSSPNDMRRDVRVLSARPRGLNRESRLRWSAALCVQPTKRAMRRLGAMRIAESHEHAGEPSVVEE